MHCEAVWCCLMQCVAVCCSALQCIAVCCSVCSVLQCATHITLQIIRNSFDNIKRSRVAVCWSGYKFSKVSLLQCVTHWLLTSEDLCLAVLVARRGHLLLNAKVLLQHAASHCNTLQCTATHCNALQHTATHCNTLHQTTPYGLTMQHCTTLQNTATHGSTLQHTSTHCNTLQHCNTATLPPGDSCSPGKPSSIGAARWKETEME